MVSACLETYRNTSGCSPQRGVLLDNHYIAVTSGNYGGTKEISFPSLIIEAAHASLREPCRLLPSYPTCAVFPLYAQYLISVLLREQWSLCPSRAPNLGGGGMVEARHIPRPRIYILIYLRS
jgi:hypothetical protein